MLFRSSWCMKCAFYLLRAYQSAATAAIRTRSPPSTTTRKGDLAGYRGRVDRLSSVPCTPLRRLELDWNSRECATTHGSPGTPPSSLTELLTPRPTNHSRDKHRRRPVTAGPGGHVGIAHGSRHLHYRPPSRLPPPRSLSRRVTIAEQLRRERAHLHARLPAP